MTPELYKLRESLPDLGPIVNRLELELIDDPSWDEPSDTSYLSEAELANPDIAANVDAMSETNKLISWFGKDAEGYLGLWRGPANRDLNASPVVRLDTEGQYSIVAATIADYLALAMPEDEFATTRETLTRAGFKVGFNPDAIWGALDGFDDDPNAFRNELYEQNRVKRGLPRSDTEVDEEGGNGVTDEPVTIAVTEISSGEVWVPDGSQPVDTETLEEELPEPLPEPPAAPKPAVAKAAPKPPKQAAKAAPKPAPKPTAKAAPKPTAKAAAKPAAKSAAKKPAAKPKPVAKAKAVAKAKPAAKKAAKPVAKKPAKKPVKKRR